QNAPSTATWEQQRDDFIERATPIVGEYSVKEIADAISLEDLMWERSADPLIMYKLKLRVVLRNETGKTVEVNGRWDSSGDYPEPWKPLPELPWQLEENGRWGQEGKASIGVRPGRRFRTWIGFEVGLSDDELRQRGIKHRIGRLVLRIRAEGHTGERIMSL